MIELLVATAMMLIVTAAAVTVLTSVMRQQPKITTPADQIGTARVAMEKITADVRQGTEVSSTGPSQMTLKTYCHKGAAVAATCVVTYACALEGGKTTYGCTRAVTGGTTTAIMNGLSTGEVFCFYPNIEKVECGKASTTEKPAYVSVIVQFPRPSKESKTILEDGAALHNSSALLRG